MVLTLKCELDLQIMKKDPKEYYQMAFEHTNFILTYKMGKGTFGTIHSSYGSTAPRTGGTPAFFLRSFCTVLCARTVL